MARKKVEPITGFGNDENKLTVQKSLPLFALWRSELSLAEFKILDSYLSRINSHEPEKRVVEFEKGELERLLGVQKINKKDLTQRLKHLMGNVVEIPDSSSRKGFRLVTLFEEADAEPDERGYWKIRLECTQKAMKYIFNIENLGYLRYKLRCITALTSRYSYVMFVYLEANRFRKSWEVELDELKAILNCDKEEYAREFKYFSRDVLKKVHKELTEKTECRYSYEPVKRGRSVVAIRFTLESLAPQIESGGDYDPDQYTIDDLQQMDEDREAICCGFGGPEFSGFTPEQLRALKDMGWSKVKQEDVDRHKAELGDIKLACEYATSDYLRWKILTAQTRHPKNLYAYVCKMIDNDKTDT